ncbi:MAG TPA: type II toxin-antitoxin system prevent-host-death family antitoxin [Verrucomicrobiae bacterium]|jgi:prevent-host-death family protein
MKEKKTISYKSTKASEPAVLRDAAVAEWGRVVTVRDAKAHLSALLEWVSTGHELTITSDGQPKAILSPVEKREARKVFTGTWEHLKKMPPWRGGPTAEEIIRAERDSRP